MDGLLVRVDVWPEHQRMLRQVLPNLGWDDPGDLQGLSIPVLLASTPRGIRIAEILTDELIVLNKEKSTMSEDSTINQANAEVIRRLAPPVNGSTFHKGQRVHCGPYAGVIVHGPDPSTPDCARVQFERFKLVRVEKIEHLAPLEDGEALPPVPKYKEIVSTPQGAGVFLAAGEDTLLWQVEFTGGDGQPQTVFFYPSQVTILKQPAGSPPDSVSIAEKETAPAAEPESVNHAFIGRRARFSPYVGSLPMEGEIQAVGLETGRVQIVSSGATYWKKLDEVEVLSDEDTPQTAATAEAEANAEAAPVTDSAQDADLDTLIGKRARFKRFTDQWREVIGVIVAIKSARHIAIQYGGADYWTKLDEIEVLADETETQAEVAPAPATADEPVVESDEIRIVIETEDAASGDVAVSTILVDYKDITGRVDDMIEKANSKPHAGQLDYLRSCAILARDDMNTLLDAIAAERDARLKAEEKHARATERIHQLVKAQDEKPAPAEAAASPSDEIRADEQLMATARLEARVQFLERTIESKDAAIVKLKHNGVTLPPANEFTALKGENAALKAEVGRHEAYIRKLQRELEEAKAAPVIEAREGMGLIEIGDEGQIETRTLFQSIGIDHLTDEADHELAALRNDGWWVAHEGIVDASSRVKTRYLRLERSIDDDGGPASLDASAPTFGALANSIIDSALEEALEADSAQLQEVGS